MAASTRSTGSAVPQAKLPCRISEATWTASSQLPERRAALAASRSSRPITRGPSTTGTASRPAARIRSSAASALSCHATATAPGRIRSLTRTVRDIGPDLPARPDNGPTPSQFPNNMRGSKKFGYRWRSRLSRGGRIYCAGPVRRRPAMLKPGPIEPVPEGTARVAKAAFRKGNPLLSLRDELGAAFADADFADLFPGLGQPGLPPWRLALVTVLQFRENLPDRQAAEAVRARIDWKYLMWTAREWASHIEVEHRW